MQNSPATTADLWSGAPGSNDPVTRSDNKSSAPWARAIIFRMYIERCCTLDEIIWHFRVCEPPSAKHFSSRRAHKISISRRVRIVRPSSGCASVRAPRLLLLLPRERLCSGGPGAESESAGAACTACFQYSALLLRDRIFLARRFSQASFALTRQIS